MSKKIGLGRVISLVIGSQIGAGVFLLPSQLAPFGSVALSGWIVSTFGAIMLALIFGQLCMKIPKAGGPHVYVHAAFGKRAAFFTGWTYWVISWTSNIAVITATVGYLAPILGHTSKLVNLGLEIFILFVITLVNLRGTFFAGSIELVLTILKCIPLLLIPIAGFFFFNLDNFQPFNPKNLPITAVMNKTALLTFWAFIGLESATTTANAIENPTKVVPRAVVFGAISVALLYALNSIVIMGVVPNHTLINSSAPYVNAANIIFGQEWDIVIAIIAFLACIGTLNAWVLTSGQIAYGAAKDGLFPEFLGKTNRYNAPYVSLLITFVGTIPLMVLTISDNLVNQVILIVDAAVIVFLLVYFVCMLAFLKLYFKTNKFYSLIAFTGLIFCSWVLAYSSIMNIAVLLLLILSGVPVYLLHTRKKTA